VVIFRRATVADLPAVVGVQEAGSVAALGHVFPQDQYPFPRQELLERWTTEIADPDVDVYVSTDDAGVVTGFAASRGTELFHLGIAPDAWGTGLARRLHDALVDVMVRTSAEEATHLRLRVLEENRRARRFYEKLGWVCTGTRTRSTFEPNPVLVEYVRPCGRAPLPRP
jgi:RimJ/RimL family protein N-acetyltransferase